MVMDSVLAFACFGRTGIRICSSGACKHGQPAMVAHNLRHVTEVSGCVCNVDEFGAIRSLSFVIASYVKIG